jgi:acyl-CoA thioesterase-1
MRRLFNLSILAVAMAILTGCKVNHATQHAEQMDARSSDAHQELLQPSPPAPQVALKDDSRPRLVCFGDSLTAGYGTDPGESYPDYLQADLDSAGYRYRVVNEGVSGNTTKDGVDRIAEVIALKPAVVVVEFGGNDGLRGLPIAESRANLDTLIAKISASGSKVVIAGITLPPNYGVGYIKQFNETYTLLAKKYHTPLLPMLLVNVYGVPGMMQADETHATAAGNKIVAQNMLPLITPLLKK